MKKNIFKIISSLLLLLVLVFFISCEVTTNNDDDSIEYISGWHIYSTTVNETTHNYYIRFEGQFPNEYITRMGNENEEFKGEIFEEYKNNPNFSYTALYKSQCKTKDCTILFLNFSSSEFKENYKKPKWISY